MLIYELLFILIASTFLEQESQSVFLVFCLGSWAVLALLGSFVHSFGPLMPSCVLFGPSWTILGSFAPYCALFGPSWAVFRYSLVTFGQFLGPLSLCTLWAPIVLSLSPLWAPLGSFGPSCALFGHYWAVWCSLWVVFGTFEPPSFDKCCHIKNTYVRKFQILEYMCCL